MAPGAVGTTLAAAMNSCFPVLSTVSTKECVLHMKYDAANDGNS